MPKAQNNIVDELQNLEKLYQQLLALRAQVRQAEVVSAELLSVGAEAQTGRYLARGKAGRRKRSK